MKFLFAVLLLSTAPMYATEPTAKATDAINALGIDLLRQSAQPGVNVVFSPYSIQNSLAMAYAGADGVTRDQMAKVLHYPREDPELHNSFASLREALEEINQASSKEAARLAKYGVTNEPTTINVANQLFVQTGYEFRQPFLDLLKNNYNSPIESLDFASQSSAAVKHINDWIEEQTRRRIRYLVADGTLDALTRLVLVNAVYLKAPWAEPFKTSATMPAPFYLNGAKIINVPTMTQTREFSYAKGNGFSMLRLPYGGYGLWFLIFLPDEGADLAALESKLTPGLLAGQVGWESRDVTLYLPKFEVEPPTFSLGNVLQTLGMKSAFDKPIRSANFDRIAPRHPDDYLRMSDVLHKTFLSLDEKGTEAAVATAVPSPTMGSDKPQDPFEMRVDHPFVFAIQHQPSGACLFLGHVNDPR